MLFNIKINVRILKILFAKSRFRIEIKIKLKLENQNKNQNYTKIASNCIKTISKLCSNYNYFIAI